jgi:hypothetical protein
VGTSVTVGVKVSTPSALLLAGIGSGSKNLCLNSSGDRSSKKVSQWEIVNFELPENLFNE